MDLSEECIIFWLNLETSLKRNIPSYLKNGFQ